MLTEAPSPGNQGKTDILWPAYAGGHICSKGVIRLDSRCINLTARWFHSRSAGLQQYLWPCLSPAVDPAGRGWSAAPESLRPSLHLDSQPQSVHGATTSPKAWRGVGKGCSRLQEGLSAGVHRQEAGKQPVAQPEKGRQGERGGKIFYPSPTYIGGDRIIYYLNQDTFESKGTINNHAGVTGVTWDGPRKAGV